MIKIVIIDDERHSRRVLRKMLVDFCDGVSILGEAEDVHSGIELLNRVKPDLVLLDIEMPNGDGFDILNALGDANFHVVFVTGYDQFAIKAIKYAALDYLLKPVNLEELQIAIDKLRLAKKDNKGRLRYFFQRYGSRHDPPQQIILPGRDSHVVVELNKILRIEADGSYVMMYLEEDKSYLVVNSLSYYENLLPAQSFFRIHKSHLINIEKVEQVTTGRMSKVRLIDGSELDIAARRKAAFNHVLKQLGRL